MISRNKWQVTHCNGRDDIWPTKKRKRLCMWQVSVQRQTLSHWMEDMYDRDMTYIFSMWHISVQRYHSWWQYITCIKPLTHWNGEYLWQRYDVQKGCRPWNISPAYERLNCKKPALQYGLSSFDKTKHINIDTFLLFACACAYDGNVYKSVRSVDYYITSIRITAHALVRN